MPKTTQRDLPLTEQVVERIRLQIAAGELDPGRYLPSERELCRQMSVSRFTVRSALGSLVDEGLLERRPSKGYMVHSGSERRVSGKAGAALMFLHAHGEEDLLSGYHARLWAGARLEAVRLGVRTVITSVSGERASAEKAREIRAIAGGIICDSDDEEWIDALLAAGLKVIRVDHMAVRANAPKLDTVIQDDYEGIGSAVEHLYEKGHRRVGYLDFCKSFEPKRRGHAARRLGAYVGECRRLGLDEDRRLIAAVPKGGESSPGSALKVLDAGATALIPSHDFLLGGARAALAERGIEVPGEFGLVVWGEPGNGNQEDYPTHVTWSKEQMGREAVRRLFQGLRGPSGEPCTVKVSTNLVDRGTGGRGPAADA